MHYHCEVVIPPTMDIEGAITSVMKRFCEHEPETAEEREEWSQSDTFWDFWVIGGRWAGHKLMARHDQTKLDAFHAWLTTEKVTVSGVQFGKQELSPASQQGKVDAKWNEMFPSAEFVPCPIFRHSNDQFGKGLRGSLPGDVLRLSELPADLTCSRVIFAKPSYESKSDDYTGPLEAGFMLCEDQWNGCNYMKVDWNGKFASAVEKYLDNLKRYKEEFVERTRPKDDWLVVTVDYHT